MSVENTSRRPWKAIDLLSLSAWNWCQKIFFSKITTTLYHHLLSWNLFFRIVRQILSVLGVCLALFSDNLFVSGAYVDFLQSTAPLFDKVTHNDVLILKLRSFFILLCCCSLSSCYVWKQNKSARKISFRYSRFSDLIINRSVYRRSHASPRAFMAIPTTKLVMWPCRPWKTSSLQIPTDQR